MLSASSAFWVLSVLTASTILRVLFTDRHCFVQEKNHRQADLSVVSSRCKYQADAVKERVERLVCLIRSSQILCWFYADIMLILCWYCADSMQILCWSYADIMLIQCWYHTYTKLKLSIMVILCKYCANIVLIISWFCAYLTPIFWWFFADINGCNMLQRNSIFINKR